MPRPNPLPKNPTVEELLAKVNELIGLHRELLDALYNRQIIY